MKHTIKLLTLAFTLAAILTLTGCPEPVNTIEPPVWDDGVVTTEPTCTTEGVKTYTCSNGETRTETIPALGHDMGDKWEITKNPTCTEKGSKTRKCSHCGETETVEIDPENHEYQGGYCETCEKYKFENRFIVRVYTSKDEFIKDISTYSVGLSSNNENNSPYDECKFSFESENPSMTVDTLIHKKLRYLNYNVVGYKVKEQDTPISIMEYEEIFEESINRIYSILVEPQIN